MSLPFYIVVGSEETADTAEIEVLKDAGGSEKLMTRLRRGEYTSSFITYAYMCADLQILSIYVD
jgi:hypothetical protein